MAVDREARILAAGLTAEIRRILAAAYTELLHPVDVRLLHAPGAVGRVGRPGRAP